MFMSTGHDEYWSGNQRANVVAARDHGVNLAFFSGNEVFWKTQFGPSTDGSNTPERTLTTYKDTHFDSPQNPNYPPTWTGTWEDPRFSPPGDGGNPSNALTGQKFLVNSGTTDIKVPAAYAQLRLWRNTPVASLSTGQSVTLGAGLGTLGYEWDTDTDNGFHPAGLFDLSSTTSTSAEIFTDYGSTTQQGGTATHNLTMYKAASGALVFGAGTVQWAWGLDNTWTGAGTDRTMQQATVNLFADMGAQPFALISGLVSASPSLDTTPPTSQITSPAPGANLTDASPVTVQGTASDSGGGVVAGVEVSTDAGATWHPANGTTNWSYTWSAHGSPSAVLKSRAVDDSGNLESPGAGTTVSVACPCSIFGSSLAPTTADGADPNSIEVGVKFTSDRFGTINGIRFYKSNANTGTHVGNLWTAGGQLLASATFSGETASGWQQVNFSTPVPITPNTTYVASYFAPKGHYANDNNYLYRLPQSPNLRLPVHDSPPPSAPDTRQPERGLQLRHVQRVPAVRRPRDQLLGGRRVHASGGARDTYECCRDRRLHLRRADLDRPIDRRVRHHLHRHSVHRNQRPGTDADHGQPGPDGRDGDGAHQRHDVHLHGGSRQPDRPRGNVGSVQRGHPVCLRVGRHRPRLRERAWSMDPCRQSEPLGEHHPRPHGYVLGLPRSARPRPRCRR
jgi:hypothetical protein